MTKVAMRKEEEEMIRYCRDRLDLYIMLEKKYGHEKACKILSLYDLERNEKCLSQSLITLGVRRTR